MIKSLPYLMGQASEYGLPDVAANPSTLEKVLSVAFLAVGALSAIFIIVGGLQYVISAGDPQQTARAKNTIIYAVVGLAISVFATAIVNFVLNRLV